MDWQLHVPIIFKILTDLEYFKIGGIHFVLEGNIIHRHGGWTYSPSEIICFRDAAIVFHDNACTGTPHFEALCLLEGVSYHKYLDRGRALLSRLGRQ